MSLASVGGIALTERLIRLIVPLVWLTGFSASTGYAAPSEMTKGATTGTTKGELKDVQQRIQTLGRDLAKSEGKHSDALDQLRDTETQISVATKRMRTLADERRAVQTQLNDLDNQARKLDRQAARQQAQLGRVLRSQFSHGEADALHQWLAGADPNQSARDEFFLRRLSQAKAVLIRELQSIALEKRGLAQSVAIQKAQIVVIENSERESREELLALQKQRQITLAALAGKIKAQRREIDSLKRDEQRLSKLIEQLGKSTASRARRKSSVGSVGAGNTPSPPNTRAPRTKILDADPGKVAGLFGQLRGKLRTPTVGTIKGRFGSKREEGGTTWKGIFIRADEGTEVRAVAAGTVVFSEWMRGFGNLLVIDHDDDFFSVYGNNQTLLAVVGQQISAGTPVSTVGSSGGIPEAGLYFELRHKGLAFDPLKWIGGVK